MKIVEHILSILVVVVVLMAAAVSRDQRILGKETSDIVYDLTTASGETNADVAKSTNIPPAPTKKELKALGVPENASLRMVNRDGQWQLSTGGFIFSSYITGRKIVGYSGPTPLYIYLIDGKISQVIGAKNDETPGFWRRIVRRHLLSSWNGLTPDEASEQKVEVVSGATFSSSAVIANMQQTLPLMTSTNLDPVSNMRFDWSLKNIAALLVMLFGLLCATVWKKKSSILRIIQLILNFFVLGLWTGSFLSLSLLIGWMSNGWNIATAFVLIIALLFALLMPFFGKKTYYCTHVCPLGAAQELAGKIGPKKIRISQSWMKVLKHTRKGITVLLLASMWVGVSFDWMHYEAFSAFLFSPTTMTVSSVVALVLAVSFIALSLIITRPYCRFVCPTGMLLTLTQEDK
ncbi:MAG TPA: 4Fe-4S binding protein [Bacteroidaceae bacterium]|nr:4Fe-4S binding protein [Bacteroidaceae bacterium]